MNSGKPYFRTPALSPDGRFLAFIYAYDIWMVDTTGGRAERLTAHPANHYSPRFSPDGASLAFGSTRTGSGDIYVLPLDQGDVRRLTFHSRQCNVEDWSADGQTIFFTSDREHQDMAIYAVPLTGGTPAPVYAEPYEALAHATVSPDGDTLAFNVVRSLWWRRGPNRFAPSDIWLGTTKPVQFEEGNEDWLPRKLIGSGTPHPYTGMNRWPLWSTDGSGLYFVSDRDGVENIWYRSLEEGGLRQITHFTEGRVHFPAIARNAQVVVFERDGQIWRLDPISLESMPIPIRVRADTRQTPVYVENRTRGFNELQLSPDGKKIAFVAHGEVFADFADKETNREQRQGPSFRITNTSAREEAITWMPSSQGLIYLSDRHGEQELYHYDFITRVETRLTNDSSPKWAPTCSPDGNWLAYIRGSNDIYLLNLRTAENRPFAKGYFVWNRTLAWSPDSCWLAYISHDARFFSNVYIQHIDATTSRQITFTSNIMGENLLWSHDGQFLVFTSGQYRMESQIVRVDLRPIAPLFRETEFDKLFEEKRDAKKSRGNREGEPETKEQQLQSHEAGSNKQEPEPGNQGEETEEKEPAPEKDIVTVPPPAPERTTEPETEEKSDKPTQKIEIVFEGIERRLRFLTPIQMDANAQSISHDSRDLLFLATVAGKVNVWSLPLDEPRQDHGPRQLTASSAAKRQAQFAPDGKTFLYLDDGQVTIRKFPNGNDPITLQVRGDVTVDFHEEKVQVFGEAWRLLRDTFYDATFHGRDWQALRERFLPFVLGAQTHGELTTIINLMIGELGASHTGVFWPTGWWGNDGYTGLIFDPVEQREHGRLRVAALIPDSPVALLDDAPRIGEYLIAVEDVHITPQTSLDALLQRTIGRRVRLRFAATPESSEGRDLAVRPIDGEQYGYLRYRAWVAINKAYVDRVSSGRLGYVHIEEMSYGAYQQFLADLDVEIHSKEGVVLDIRYNSGGHISTFILDVLARRNVLQTSFRDHLLTDPYHLAGNRTLNKPTVLVTNEESASDAEIFTEIYRRLGLGRVVGKPTGGRVIGTINWGMQNGSYVRLPTYAYHTPEGENLEGTGRAVDVEVERPVGEWAIGHDRQLNAAVATLLEEIASSRRGLV